MNYKEELIEGDAVDEIVDWSRFDVGRNFRNITRNLRHPDEKDVLRINQKSKSNERLDRYIDPKVKMWMDESFVPTPAQILTGSESQRLNILAQVFLKTEHNHTLLSEAAIDNMLVGNEFLVTKYCLRKLLERPGFQPTPKQRSALFNIEDLAEGAPEIADFLKGESAKWGAEQTERMKKTGDIAKSEMPKVKVKKAASMLDKINMAKGESNAVQNMGVEINSGFKKMNAVKPEGKKLYVAPGHTRKM